MPKRHWYDVDEERRLLTEIEAARQPSAVRVTCPACLSELEEGEAVPVHACDLAALERKNAMETECRICGDVTDGSTLCDICQEAHDEEENTPSEEHRCHDCGALTDGSLRCAVCQEARDEVEREENTPEDEEAGFPDEFSDL
jgi:hypothetical protein